MLSKSDPFVDRLERVSNGPWYLNESKEAPDDQVLQLSSIDTTQPWCDPTTFLDFLDANSHRRLLRCLIGRTPSEKYRRWSFKDLVRETRPPSEEALEKALAFCKIQGFAFPNPTRHDAEHLLAWCRTLDETPLVPSPAEAAQWLETYPEQVEVWWSNLDHILNFGSSFEWIIQATLQREYHALARRHVVLSKLGQLGDIDVLGFLEDGRTLMIECKSSTKGISDEHLERFLKRSSVFPADAAIFLIDADDPHQMPQRQYQIDRVMYRVHGEYTPSRLLFLGGSHIYHLRKNLYISNTGGGIFGTLKWILLHQQAFSQRKHK